jgi:CRISPR-associated protein Csm3
MARHIQLLGRVLVKANLYLKSGLRIGAADTGIVVGNINAILRNPVTNEPYIPGSSLKGKLRSLLEKAYGVEQNQPIQKIFIHVCHDQTAYQDCKICPIFGISADEAGPATFPNGSPTRLVVRDAPLSNQSRIDLQAKRLDSEFSELKTEVAIDRLTSKAVPRTQERIPAGTVLDFEAVFSLYYPDDAAHFLNFCQSLRLLEQDFLGGSGSRGYGQIAFQQIKLTRARAKISEAYNAPKNYDSIDQILNDTTLTTWLGEKLATPVAGNTVVHEELSEGQTATAQTAGAKT